MSTEPAINSIENLPLFVNSLLNIKPDQHIFSEQARIHVTKLKLALSDIDLALSTSVKESSSIFDHQHFSLYIKLANVVPYGSSIGSKQNLLSVISQIKDFALE